MTDLKFFQLSQASQVMQANLELLCSYAAQYLKCEL